MNSLLVLLSTLAAVSALSTRSASRRGSAVTMMAEKSKSLPFLPQPEALVGMVGDVGFDPLGFSKNIDVRWLREAELKHGRIAMLATLGFIVAEFVHLPGDVHNVGSVAAHDAAVKYGAMWQLFIWLGLFEVLSAKGIIEMLEGSGRAPGDFGFDPLKFSKGKPEKFQADLALKEMQNGRLAMIAFSGIVTGAVLSGKGFPYF